MTVSQFLDWAPAQSGSWRLVDGVPQAMAPGSRVHGSIQAEFARLLGNWLLDRCPGCVVVTEPGIVPRVSASNNYRVPDLAVTCSPDLDQRQEVENPIVIIEILSPGNRAQTWMNVWAYSTIPSLNEIIVVHSDMMKAVVLRKQPDGQWPVSGTVLEPEDELQLQSFGFQTSVSSLYRTTRLASGSG